MKIGRNDPCPCGSGEKYKKCCQNAVVVLLFGAGASHGSSTTDRVPPLGPGLFTDLSASYTNTWGKISGTVAETFHKDFEDGMDALNDQAGDTFQINNIAALWRDAAIYFSKFRINNPANNLYCRLFSKYREQITNGSIILSTLNYECLIEIALSLSGMPTTNYLGLNKGIQLRKLHGSCNFIPVGFDMSWINTTVNLKFGFTLNPAMMKYVDPQQVEFELSKTLGAAMSLYHKEKRNMIAPTKIQQMRDELRAYLSSQNPKAKALISVGVNPNRADTHLWDAVTKSPAKLYFVGNKDKIKDWTTDNGKGQYIGHRFDDSFDAICQVINGQLKYRIDVHS